jgi:hypothetical protein
MHWIIHSIEHINKLHFFLFYQNNHLRQCWSYITILATHVNTTILITLCTLKPSTSKVPNHIVNTIGTNINLNIILILLICRVGLYYMLYTTAVTQNVSLPLVTCHAFLIALPITLDLYYIAVIVSS